MEEDKIKLLFDNGLWWMFLGSLISADIEEEDKNKAKEILKELIQDIPKSDIPEDIKEKSLEICNKGLNL